jgi:hypothetical protein
MANIRITVTTVPGHGQRTKTPTSLTITAQRMPDGIIASIAATGTLYMGSAKPPTTTPFKLDANPPTPVCWTERNTNGRLVVRTFEPDLTDPAAKMRFRYAMTIIRAAIGCVREQTPAHHVTFDIETVTGYTEKLTVDATESGIVPPMPAVKHKMTVPAAVAPAIVVTRKTIPAPPTPAPVSRVKHQTSAERTAVQPASTLTKPPSSFLTARSVYQTLLRQLGNADLK